jgi:hypothetical protein
MAKQQYDRAAEDLGNIVALEHVNLQVPNQTEATLFYVTGLGLTRDPYMNTGIGTMWVNVGKSQFHLPPGEPWVLRGAIGLVTPDRDGLLKRLAGIEKQLQGTQFAVAENNDHVAVTCPWGNRFRMHSPDPDRFGAVNLGMPYLEFDVPAGSAAGIERFYREVLGAATRLEGNGAGQVARVSVGENQEFQFRETKDPIPAFDGHHVQVYVRDFSGPHREMQRRELLTEESNRCQYRFEHLIDLDSNETLFELEHEVRSMTHPMYARPLVNRNPAQSQRYYQRGGDQWRWDLPQTNETLPDAPPITGPRAQALAERRARRAARGM